VSETPNLSERYLFVEGNSAMRIDVSRDEFWNQLMSGQPTDPAIAHVADADGWLFSHFAMDSDMVSQEMHPNGDEIIYQLSGCFDLVLEESGGDRVLELTSGATGIVPRGVWHRFIVREPGEALALTYGRGTQHRPILD